MTLTEKALASSSTAHLARWHDGPKTARVRYLQNNFFYDAGDPWRGIKIGKTYGCLYHVTREGLIPVQYDGPRGIEFPIPNGPLYSWQEIQERGL